MCVFLMKLFCLFTCEKHFKRSGLSGKRAFIEQNPAHFEMKVPVEKSALVNYLFIREKIL